MVEFVEWNEEKDPVALVREWPCILEVEGKGNEWGGRERDDALRVYETVGVDLHFWEYPEAKEKIAGEWWSMWGVLKVPGGSGGLTAEEKARSRVRKEEWMTRLILYQECEW